MATNFKLKRSSVANKRPGLTNLELGELALNTYDGFLFTERNGLGITTVTNLTPWYENYGAGSIFYSNKVGIGTTAVPDTNQLLVKGGTETDKLNVTGISTYAGHVLPATDSLYDLGSSTKYWRNLYVDSITGGGGGVVIGDDIITRNLKVTGISTFVGIITASATENVIPFLFNAWSDIPSASAYHGAFIHVHARGKGYFAHAANWYELVNKELDGTIGVGTEQVRVGVTTVTTFNATGHVTLGDANTDNIVLNGEINSNVIPNTNIAYDLGSSTKKWGNLYINKITAGGGNTIIDDDITTRNLSVTGLSTFTGNIDANGDLDVDGATSLDATTVDGLLDINAGGQANTFKVEDLTDNRIVIAGSGGELEDSGNLTFDGSTLVVTGDGTFSGNVSIAGTLTYQDVTNVDSVGIATARVGLDVLSGGINAVGIVTADGLDAIGIQSGGVNITTGIITAINFTGTGNTVTYDSSTKIVSVSVGGAGGAGGKFVENNTGIHTLSNVGIGTTNASDKLKVLGDVAFTGALKVSPLGLSGSSGNYLKSVGTGVTWAAFPSSRTGLTTTATAGQTSFNFSYNVGFVDVFLNGVKLPSTEFTASNGSTIVLDDAAFANDTLEFISLNTLPVTSGGAQNLTGLADVTITGTPVIGETLQHNGSQFVNDYTPFTTTTSTSQTLINGVSAATYRSVEYTVQATRGTNYHVTKLLAIHNGTNVYFNEYGTLFTNSSLSAFELDVNSGIIRMLATPASTNSTEFKVKFTGIKV